MNRPQPTVEIVRGWKACAQIGFLSSNSCSLRHSAGSLRQLSWNLVFVPGKMTMLFDCGLCSKPFAHPPMLTHRLELPCGKNNSYCLVLVGLMLGVVHFLKKANSTNKELLRCREDQEGCLSG